MSLLKQLARYVFALARELSDENGYRRYLQRNARVHSRAEWRSYIDARHRRKYQNAKCC